MRRHLIDYILMMFGSSENAAPETEEKLLDTPMLKDNLAESVKNFIDEIPGGFFVYKAIGDGDIIYANHAIVRLFGCDDFQDFLTQVHGTFKGLVHPEDYEEVQKSIDEQISENHELDYVEYRIVRKDGKVRWLEDYGHFISNAVVGDIFYVFVSDATEKIERRKAMQNRRLGIIEALSMNYESIFYVDLKNDTVIPYRLNARSGKHFNENRDPRKFSVFVPEFVNAWIHPDNRADMMNDLDPETMRKKLAAGQSYSRNFICVYEGGIIHKRMAVVKVAGDNEKAVVGLRNVDEEYITEMQQKKILEDAVATAERASNAKDIFLSNVSHDMRTPLNAIFGYVNLAKKDVGDKAAVTDYLDRIETAGSQLLELTKKALELTDIETKVETVNETECNLAELIDAVYEAKCEKAREKGIEFEKDTSALENLNVYADASKIKQILSQLIDNAIKYTDPHGKVQLSVNELSALPNGFIEYSFAVKDTGDGIDKNMLETIFEPFVREKDTTESGVFGLGIGLTIAKELTQLMGGHVDIKSEVGKGSEFSVIFGLRAVKKTAKNIDVSAVLDEIKSKKILIVEDNDINREIETELLEELGFSVEGAENGKIAVDKLTQSPDNYYAVVLMDIQMPVLDGRQAAERIRKMKNKNLSNIPIIAVSANAFESDKRLSEKAGIDAHIAKPLDVGLLLDTMSSVVSARMQAK